jgi:hypothetical protein
MDTETRYPRRVARPRWKPPNAEVDARIERVAQLYRQQQEVEAEYKRALVEVHDPDGDDVPIAHLAERIGIERKTVYRHLGRSMT